MFPFQVSGSSSVGRASAFQAECREFEPRLPLHPLLCNQEINVLLFKVKAHVAQQVERFLGKEEVQRFESVHGLHFFCGKRYFKHDYRCSPDGWRHSDRIINQGVSSAQSKRDSCMYRVQKKELYNDEE